jgi:ectoine hydroxylase-related dioxygenase (phytanoyl-CoA dioxygenase family)
MHSFPAILVSNDYALSTTPERLGWLEPTDPNERLDKLREKYRVDGYLWLKHFLERESVLDFRRRYFEAMQHTGLLAEGSDPKDGIYSNGSVDRAAVRRVETKAVRWASFESLCLAPRIWQFYETFLGGPVYLHKRKLIRRSEPGSSWATPAHYDLTYLRGGTDRSLCTSWLPFGDVSAEMGGLVYLEGSDAHGRKLEAEFRACNAELPPEERISAYNRNMAEGGWLTKDLPSLADRINSRWLVADYEAGDMVIHSPFMIHAATTNNDNQGRMRLSADIRYQLVREEIDERWSGDWHHEDHL